MKLRLTRKFAEFINGIDLSRARTGDLIEFSDRDAAVLMAEGWAVPDAGTHPLPRVEAADRSRPSRRGPNAKEGRV
jgi:hypothetical protein